MLEKKDWGDNQNVIRVLQLIEEHGHNVHVRRVSLDHGISEPIAIEIYAVREEPNATCRIVEVSDDREHGEYLAAVQLAESLGISIISVDAGDAVPFCPERLVPRNCSPRDSYQ